jgi:hypothetical protein
LTSEAYNGVYKERLLQRVVAKGTTSASSVDWRLLLPMYGYDLFLFFNVGLIQHKLNIEGGSMAFVDDYTA